MAYASDARTNYRQTRHHADDGNNGETEFNEITDYFVTWSLDATDATAAVVTTDRPVHVPVFTIDVIAAYWLQQVASTANATSYATIALRKNDGAGSTITAVGSVDTQSSTIAANSKASLSITASARQIASGEALFVDLGKTSNGVKLGPGVLVVHCRRT